MHKKFKINKTIFLSYIFVNTIIISLMVVEECDVLYAIVLLMWINMMFYSLNRITQRIALFCFGIAFFTFLLGRDGMEYLFNHELETIFTPKVNHHAYVSMFLGLSGVWFGFIFFNRHTKPKSKHTITEKEEIYYGYIRKYSLICFYIAYPFAIAMNLGIAYFVYKYGYAAKFTDFRAIVENSPLFYTLSKIELILPTSFSIYMATLPSKDSFKKIVKPYFLYLIITLGTGGRAGFMLGILLIVIFIAFMQQMQPSVIWVNKKKIKYLILFIPFVAIGGSFMNSIRFGETNENNSVIDAFSDFFYDQGVTSNALKRAYQYEDYIPKQPDFYTLEFLHTGIPARVLGYKVYQGNTVEHATKGGSFTHALGYTMMGNSYLAGRGTGTSYIAELYYDFGYLGIFLGSCLYGYIFSLINNTKRSGLFSRSIIFIILTKLLWAPRGGYSAFLSFIFAPTTIILLIFVFSCAQISFVNNLKKLKPNIKIYESIDFK